MEGVTCPCCEDLFVDPMTLECGHIVCRLCLAGWCICEGKRECPVCHQVWYSNMLVAIADYKLRTTIERVYPDELKERITFLSENPTHAIILRHFEEMYQSVNPEPQLTMQALRRENDQADSGVNPDLQVIYWVVMIAFLVIVVILNAMWVGNYEIFSTKTTENIKKPVHLWSQQDVVVWSNTLGPWAKEKLAATLLENNIDGNSLLKLDETSLLDLKEGDENHEILTDLEIQMFLSSLRSLKLTLGTDPQTLWEFKDIYPNTVIIVLCLLKFHYPRLALLCVGLLQYHKLFVPFVHVMSPVLPDMQHIPLSTYKFPPPNFGQILHVTVIGLLFPYLMFADFICRRFSAGHWLLASIFIVNFAIMTMFDLNFITKNSQQGIRTTSYEFKGMVIISAIFLIVYNCNLIPSFLINLYFYMEFGMAIINPTLKIMCNLSKGVRQIFYYN